MHASGGVAELSGRGFRSVAKSVRDRAVWSLEVVASRRLVKYGIFNRDPKLCPL